MVKRAKFHGIFVFLMLVAVITALGQNRTVLKEAERISGDKFKYTVKSPKGANVISVDPASAQMLAAIDNGFTELFAVARKNHYSKRLNYSDYTIYIAKADRTKNGEGAYSPAIAIGAAQYAGTDYDKGGVIYVAGIVVALSPPTFMIAEQTKDFNTVSNAVRNEGEHLVLYQNDRRRYEATKDHSQGGGHPILK